MDDDSNITKKQQKNEVSFSLSVLPVMPGNPKTYKNKTKSDETSNNTPQDKDKFLSHDGNETRTMTKNKYNGSNKAPFVVHVYTDNPDTNKQAHPLLVSRLITLHGTAET